MLIDYRRSLLDALPGSYVGAYAGDAQAARQYASQLAGKARGATAPARPVQRRTAGSHLVDWPGGVPGSR